MRKFLFLSTALLIVSKNAFSLNAIPEECFLVSSSNQFGNNSEIKVTAKCDIDFSLGARILFDGGNSGSPWGSFPGGWMDWKSIANGFQYEPIDSSIKHILTIGNTLILQYSAANEASNIKIFTEAPPPPSPISGSLSIKFPEKPTGVNQDPIVTLNSEKNSLKIDGNWNSVTTKNKIPLNTYKIKANVVCDNLGNICYQGQPSANSITFTKDSPKSNISVDYKQIKQIPIELSITGLAKYINELKINFVNKDGLSFVRNINLNSNLVTNLPEGSYSIQIDKIPANDSSYYYTVQSIEPQTLEVTNSIKASIFIKFALVKNSSDFVGYYTSWSEGYADKVTDASKLKLANLPTGINIIEVSFAKPDLVYSPHSDNLSLTGLQFSGTKDPIKAAIKIAQEKGQKVLLAVGGATYNNWGNTNFHGIAQLVDDMGFDGVDIDYEMDGGCSHTKQGDGWVLQGCQSDKELTSILINMRKALPNKIISAATRSVGAEYFTKNRYNTSGGWYFPILNAGKNIDIINLMSYDVEGYQKNPADYDPIQEAENFRAIFNGKVNIGLEVGLKIAGVPQDKNYIQTLACYSYNNKTDNNFGIMMWPVDGSAQDSSLNYTEMINIVSSVKSNPTELCNPKKQYFLSLK